MQNNKGLPNGVKIAIISVLGVIALITTIIAIAMPSSTKTNNSKGNVVINDDGDYIIDNTSEKKEEEEEESSKSTVPKEIKSRTVMLFLIGTNLETKGALATCDLSKIIPSSIDLDKNKILIYTGGTQFWHNNFISPYEEAIFELTPDGFKKIMTYPQNNIGNSATLSAFLNYSYNYSKTDAYDLIFYDHGSGIAGAMHDEYTGDMLNLVEISEALKNSPFNKKNKLESIIFRTCLNANVEMASTLAPYANYMVASEETTVGAYGFGVLGFLNTASIDKNTIDYGKEFITSYQNMLQEMIAANYGTAPSSYSVVDLSKISELNKKIDNFFAKIDVSQNYNDLARIRSNLYMYGTDEDPSVSEFDTVDLYELVDSLKQYDESGAEKIKSYLRNDVVVYNWSSTSHSNGLSMYFPFTGKYENRKWHVELYKLIDVSKNYRNFITKFYQIQTTGGGSTFSFDLSNNKTSQKKNEFKLKLSDEQIKNFASASYIIFKKNEDGTYSNIFMGKDATLDKDGYVSTKISNSMIKIVDEDDNSFEFPIVWQKESPRDSYKEYIVPVWLYEGSYEAGTMISDPHVAANIHLKVDKKNKIHVAETMLVGGEDLEPTTMALDLKNYNTIDFNTFNYNILDENGNYITDWQGTHRVDIFRVQKGKYHFELASLDKKDFYCVFAIKDIYNNAHWSNLIGME